MENSSRKIDHTCDEIVQSVYRSNNNFLVKQLNPKSNICIIFFTGNGLYYPNEETEFIEKVIKNNRYEWENISKDKTFSKKAGKLIFVRDVHKQWYVEEINEDVCNVDKTFKLLKDLTKGHQIITIGNSAGGYAAVLFGCLLKAEKIFSISGQFVLEDIEKEKLLSKHYQDIEYSKYYDLRILLESYNGTVFYIFPNKSEQDLKQNEYVKDLKNIFRIRINSENHGTGLLPENYKFVLFEELPKLRRISTTKEYEPSEILRMTSPFFSRMKIHIKIIIKMIMKKLGIFDTVKRIIKGKA